MLLLVVAVRGSVSFTFSSCFPERRGRESDVLDGATNEDDLEEDHNFRLWWVWRNEYRCMCGKGRGLDLECLSLRLMFFHLLSYSTGLDG